MPGFPDISDPLYKELRRLARNKLRLLPNQSLQPTMLVNEAYLRLMEQGHTWHSQTEFYRAAARVMRFALIDHIRAKKAEKRGGNLQQVDIQVTLPGRDAPVGAEELLTLHESLDRLQAEHPRHLEVVMLRYFIGLTVAEVATALELSVVAVERHWRFARAWLRNDMC
jgi:RNA polymerase sigma factor (TIGR02999 family)